MEGPIVYTAVRNNQDLPWVMSFYLVPQMPRLVAMVAKFSMCVRKVNNFIYFMLIFFFFFLFFYIIIQGKQHKMLKKRPVIR